MLVRRRRLEVESITDSVQAGLTTEEREIMAKAYDSGAIKVCVATNSLAAGINL